MHNFLEFSQLPFVFRWEYINTEKALCRLNIELTESARFGPNVAGTMKEKKRCWPFFLILFKAMYFLESSQLSFVFRWEYINTEKALCCLNIELKVSARFRPKVARTMKEKNHVGFFFYFLPRIWIVKRGFTAKTIVDEQLSEAETSSSACGWYKARLLR